MILYAKKKMFMKILANAFYYICFFYRKEEGLSLKKYVWKHKIFVNQINKNMKRILAALLFFSFIMPEIKAWPDEGMWLPLYIKQLNEKNMQELGMKLSAEDIYNINQSSIKDAVLRLGTGFCTGEIVSEKGLVFTNHHCGYDAIAGLSSVEEDILTHGFWAYSMDQEKPIPDMSVSRLVYMESLTAFFEELDKNYESGLKAIRAREYAKDSIMKAATEGNHYEAEIKEMYGGREFYLMVYETFTDVRFVGAPPSSIGKFGGDTDNWMWPRHTGDFSILRVYTGPDGKPADYSENNIPYKPMHVFPISLKGIEEDDFAMILGYPGTTERYLTSYDIDFKQNIEQPALIEIFGYELASMKEAMDADDAVRIELASDYASISNYYKYLKGQNLGLKRYGLIEEYRQKEMDFTQWVNKDETRKEKYGELLSDMEKQYAMYQRIHPGYYYISYGLFRLAILGHIYVFNDFYKKLAEGASKEEIAGIVDNKLKPECNMFFSGITMERNQELMRIFLFLTLDKMKNAEKLSFYSQIMEQKAESLQDKVNLYLDGLFSKSILYDQIAMDKFLEKPKASKLKKDQNFELITGLLDFYDENYSMTARSVPYQIEELLGLYLEGLREWKSDMDFYPDANSTLRMSYGTVKSYYPRNAVFYNYITTHYGILEKEDPTEEEFRVDPKLKELLLAKDFGQYGMNSDTLVVCFLTNNDITGGNSGSPVINDNGELIGIAFDGNWEAMTGDLVVDPVYNRTINVDIRYVLFVIDKFADAQNLMEELHIVK
jgi:hypothetical protein